jgi:hypothetical protein
VGRLLLSLSILSLCSLGTLRAAGCGSHDPGVGTLSIAVTEAQTLVTADIRAEDAVSFVRDMVLLGKAIQAYVTAVAHLADDTVPLAPGDPSSQCCLASQSPAWADARDNTLFYVHHYQNSLTAGVELFGSEIIVPSVEVYIYLLNLLNVELAIFETLELAQCGS